MRAFLIVFCCYFLVLFSSVTQTAFAQPLLQPAEQEQEQPKEQEQEKEKEPSDENKTEEQSTSSSTIQRSKIEIAPPIDAIEQKKSDLNHYLPEKTVQTVLAGPNDHITLIETNQTANSKGVMVLLPDWHQTAASPKAMNDLRAKFPQQGWTTITLQPPSKPDNYPSLSLKSEQRAQENLDILTAYQEELSAILTAVIEQAKTYPGIIVVVAEGRNGAILPSIYQKELSEEPMALITLSAYLDDDSSSEIAAKNLAQIDLPVLDFILKTDNGLILQNAELRKKHVNQALKSYYRQKQLHNIHTGYYPKNQLLKEISGWLKSIGW